jgi:hypothetical protein
MWRARRANDDSLKKGSSNNNPINYLPNYVPNNSVEKPGKKNDKTHPLEVRCTKEEDTRE